MRRFRLLTAAVAAALAVTGCAGIPDSGPTTRVGVENTSGDDVDTVYEFGGPRPGASPVEIVEGFFDAMMAQPLTTKGAQEFLTERARREWKPERQTVIYQQEIRVRPFGRGLVETWISKLGTLDDRGRFQATAPVNAEETSQLVLQKEHHQWRIANPPDALYVDAYFFDRSYVPFSLYFLGPGNTMVPDPIYLPADLQPATALVRGLLKGPPPSWRGQLGTAFPSFTDLEGSVPITDEVAEVRLEGPLTELRVERQRLLSAQLILTLSQLADGGPVPELEGVRIFADGVPLTIPGVPAVQGLDRWSGFDPDLLPTRDRLYALQEGRLVQVDRRKVTVLEGSLWGARRQGIRSFDVNLGLDQVVAVSTDGTRLMSGRLYDSAGQAPRILDAVGTDLATPVATIGREWLVVDRTPSGTSRLLITDGSRVWPGVMGGLEQYRVESLSLSPDGMRYLALARPSTPDGFGEPRILMGRVQRSSSSVSGLSEPRALVVGGHTLDEIRSASWSSSTTVAVLGRRDGLDELEAFTVRIDGSELATDWLLPEVRPVRLVAAVGDDRWTYLVDTQGRLWANKVGQWVATTMNGPDESRAKGLSALNFAG